MFLVTWYIRSVFSELCRQDTFPRNALFGKLLERAFFPGLFAPSRRVSLPVAVCLRGALWPTRPLCEAGPTAEPRAEPRVAA